MCSQQQSGCSQRSQLMLSLLSRQQSQPRNSCCFHLKDYYLSKRIIEEKKRRERNAEENEEEKKRENSPEDIPESTPKLCEDH